MNKKKERDRGGNRREREIEENLKRDCSASSGSPPPASCFASAPRISYPGLRNVSFSSSLYLLRTSALTSVHTRKLILLSAALKNDLRTGHSSSRNGSTSKRGCRDSPASQRKTLRWALLCSETEGESMRPREQDVTGVLRRSAVTPVPREKNWLTREYWEARWALSWFTDELQFAVPSTASICESTCQRGRPGSWPTRGRTAVDSLHVQDQGSECNRGSSLPSMCSAAAGRPCPACRYKPASKPYSSH